MQFDGREWTAGWPTIEQVRAVEAPTAFLAVNSIAVALSQVDLQQNTMSWRKGLSWSLGLSAVMLRDCRDKTLSAPIKVQRVIKTTHGKAPACAEYVTVSS